MLYFQFTKSELREWQHLGVATRFKVKSAKF